jgi:hypothetical protein
MVSELLLVLVHLESVAVAIPGLSNKTVNSSSRGLFSFTIPPAHEGVLASHLDKVVVGSFNAAWSGSSDGYFVRIFNLTTTNDCCGMQLKRTSTGVSSCTGNLYVWQDGNHVCCGHVCAALSDVAPVCSVISAGGLSNVERMTASFSPTGSSNNSQFATGDAYAVYDRVVLVCLNVFRKHILVT